MSEKRVVQIDSKYDVLKIILALGVVAIHTKLYPMVLYPWLRLAVPLFFVMTSYFFFSKVKKAADEKEYLKKFVVRNLKLYSFWFVILLPITLYVRKKTYFGYGVVKGIFNFVKSIFFGSTFIASWYIMASIIGTIIIWCLAKKYSNKVLVAFSFCVFMIVTFWSSYGFLFSEYEAIDKIKMVYEELFNNPVMSFPASFMWLTCGKLFAENEIRFTKKCSWGILLVALIALYVEWLFVKNAGGGYDNDSYFMLLPVCISFFCLFLQIKPRYVAKSLYMRECSTVMYVMHASCAPVVKTLLEILFGFENTVIVYCLTVFVCVIGYLIIKKLTEYEHKFKVLKVLKWAY